jgi:hypothetical protein
MAVSGGACGGPSRRAGEPTYRTAAAGEPTHRTAAGGACGIAYLRWRLRQAGAGSVRRGLELGAEVGRRLRWDLAML